MKLIIVRHGETFENLNKVSQGHFNSQLTPKGIEQAKKVSQRLKDEKIDIAFSSDLDRALNTCNEILKFHKTTKLVKTSILREQAKGIFEGKTREERNKMLANDNTPFHEWHPEGGERLIDVWDKVIPFLDKIKKEYSNKHVLLVSYGGPISCILAYLHDKNIGNFRDYLPKENTAISIVNIQDKKIEFDTLNCSKHL
jgi:broad specificity phosphatase PhoE